MVKTCSALNCSTSSRHTPEYSRRGISLHQFPKNKTKRAEWASATKREGIEKGSQWIPTKSAYLCSKHFIETDFKVTRLKRTLRKNAIPTIFDFPSHAIKSEDPIARHAQNNEDTTQLSTINVSEHSYVKLKDGVLRKKAIPITFDFPNHAIKIEDTSQPSTIDVSEDSITSHAQNNDNATQPSTINISEDSIASHARNNDDTTQLSTINVSEHSYAKLKDGVLRKKAIPITFDFPRHAIETEDATQPSTIDVSEDSITRHAQNNDNATQPSTINVSEDSITGHAQNNDNATQPSTLNVSEDSYAKLKNEVQFLKRKLEKAEVRHQQAYKKLRTARKTISKQNKTICKLLEDLKEQQIVNEIDKEILSQNFHGTLTDLQAELFSKRPGIPYSEEMKLFATTLHLHSPKAYEFLQRSLNLPTSRTLRQWMATINGNLGVST